MKYSPKFNTVEFWPTSIDKIDKKKKENQKHDNFICLFESQNEFYLTLIENDGVEYFQINFRIKTEDTSDAELAKALSRVRRNLENEKKNTNS